MNTSLYEQDYYLWLEKTAQLLQDGKLFELDIENLIEEVKSLAIRDKRELKSRLITLFEHALKRQYVPLSDCYRGWEVTIRRIQSKIKDILKDSPSLVNYLQSIYDLCYEEAVQNMRLEYDDLFPDISPFSRDIEALLNMNFSNR